MPPTAPTNASTVPLDLEVSASAAQVDADAVATAVPDDVRPGVATVPVEIRTAAAVVPGLRPRAIAATAVPVGDGDAQVDAEAVVTAVPCDVRPGIATVPVEIRTSATAVPGARAGGAAPDDARAEAEVGPVDVRAVTAYVPPSKGAGGVADLRALRVAGPSRRAGEPVAEGEWVPAPAGAMVHVPRRAERRGDRGQATTEYGLVLMVAGSLAIAVLIWARESDAITGLFDLVIDKLTGGI